MPQRRFSSVFALLFALGCSSSSQQPVWTVGTVYPSSKEPDARGFLDVRGLIHEHSVYSHDACDGHPMPDGKPDAVCLADFRRGLCAVQHDFCFLSDHRGTFAEHEYPDVLLYDAQQGDKLVVRDGDPVASWMACPDGHFALIMAGTESGTMPVGLEHHVAGTIQERGDTYDEVSADAIGQFKAAGAVALVAHTEGWTVDQIVTLPLDGFEMYNLHANTMMRGDVALNILGRVIEKDPGLPKPDLIFLEIFSEDSHYLSTWGSVLARGVHRVTTMATDAHRNSFPQLMADGERIDSYRRMDSWFSNHLLIRTDSHGAWDDRALKSALLAERLYGAFEVMGYPVGFDYHAQVGADIAEMGSTVRLADHPMLVVKRPHVKNLDPKRTPPRITVRLLEAKEGGWDEVAHADGDVAFAPTEPGAYRAEVRMVPEHLRPDLGADADALLSHDYPWIYSNAIYVL